MKICLIWGLVLAIAYVLETALLPIVHFYGIGIDLLLLLTSSFALLKGERLGGLFGFMAGLLQDLASGSFFGTNILSKMLLGYVLGIASTRVFKEKIFLPVMAAIAATLFNYFILALLVLLLGYRFDLLQHLRMVLVPMLIYNVVAASPVHFFVCWLCKRVKEK